jgi:hypothetical protein
VIANFILRVVGGPILLEPFLEVAYVNMWSIYVNYRSPLHCKYKQSGTRTQTCAYRSGFSAGM